MGDVEPPAPAPGSFDTDQWARAAGDDPDAQEVVDIWGSKPHDWVHLYKVYEIVQQRVDIKEKGWASDNEITRFTRTANDPEAAGEGARHGRMSVEPPPKPMSQAEADTLVGRIVIAWLWLLGASHLPNERREQDRYADDPHERQRGSARMLEVELDERRAHHAGGRAGE